ncbi:MAG: replication-associated recombination protein A [Bacillota bacterium]|nr:replication-associated recombination protein A [Bacillota bacterium]
MDLFDAAAKKLAPLADRMRPRTLDEFFGQEHLVGEGKMLRRAIMADQLTSSIFYGPPGTGKTALAHIIANVTKSAFIKLNAVTSGVKEVREIIEQADTQLKLYGAHTYLLLDECHRWNKAQSDSILPAIEKGIIRFIGSTTENPMLTMTGAIVSRCRIFEFMPLDKEDIKKIMRAALCDRERGLGALPIDIGEDAMEFVAAMANGDARAALNALELAALTTRPGEGGRIRIGMDAAEESMQKRQLQCDEQQYYDMLSAFCKSLRGSDPDAAMHWFARLAYSGVDPRIIARRLIAHASEDVGLANPMAMLAAVAAAQAVEFIGMPEARLPLTQAIITICESPKSNSVVEAVGGAFSDVENMVMEPVPMHLRDTSYSGAGKLGYGKGYKYPHDYEGHYVEQEYMPPGMKGRVYYRPGNEGYEAEIKKMREKREKKGKPD